MTVRFRADNARSDKNLGTAPIIGHLHDHELVTRGREGSAQVGEPHDRLQEQVWIPRPTARSPPMTTKIRDLQLAQKHPDCLKYILVHEMTHYLGARTLSPIYNLMDGNLPHCSRRDALNATPLRAEQWSNA